MAQAVTASPRHRIGVGAVHISPKARANVLDALDHDRLTYGRYSREFERRFADIHGKSWAVFVNSGTSALQVGLAAMKEKYQWPDGSEVLVPAVTFVASLNVIVQNGLRPVLVDVDPDYYEMDPEQVQKIVGRRLAADEPLPVAAMPVHLFGQPCDPRLQALEEAVGIRTIADSCETMFVPGCAEADVACFSTYACHVIQTGVGGLALTDDDRLAALIRSLANHGRSGIYTGIDDALGRVETIEARFHFERMGYSYRATELEAAIGCAELDGYEENLSRRRYNAQRLIEGLSNLPIQLPNTRPGTEHAWMMFPILSDQRDRLVQHLEGQGIETRPMLPLTNQPYVRKLFGEDVESRFPVAKSINRDGLYVGVHPYLTNEDLDHICWAFHTFFGT